MCPNFAPNSKQPHGKQTHSSRHTHATVPPRESLVLALDAPKCRPCLHLARAVFGSGRNAHHGGEVVDPEAFLATGMGLTLGPSSQHLRWPLSLSSRTKTRKPLPCPQDRPPDLITRPPRPIARRSLSTPPTTHHRFSASMRSIASAGATLQKLPMRRGAQNNEAGGTRRVPKGLGV